MKVKKPRIELDDDHFGCVLNCAVRYSLGRQTYMPRLVTDFIRPLLPYVSDRTIWCFLRDLEECRNFGDPDVDEPTWKRFWADVEAENKMRQEDGQRGFGEHEAD